jgi:hypothetical protein
MNIDPVRVFPFARVLYGLFRHTSASIELHPYKYETSSEDSVSRVENSATRAFSAHTIAHRRGLCQFEMVG